jgi:hypothetical protein
MRTILLAALILITGAAQAANCPWNASYVSSKAKPLAAKEFRGITRDMLMPDIIKKLGPASREVGSGLYVLQWDVSDGRTFFVSTVSACEKPVNVGFQQSPVKKSTNSAYKKN